ncbi:MAG: hypothetical protein RIR69_514 [Actinomycetota bacterium]|jgi:protein-tyrosine phosphatase
MASTVSRVAHVFNTDGGIHEIPLPSAPGKLYLCGKHFIAPRVNEVVHTYSLDRVVCLVEEHELAHRYDDYITWHRAHAGSLAQWIPIHDLSFPSFAPALEFIQHITNDVRESRNVVVHCAAGIGRAGTTATAVLMNMGMKMHDALQHVRQYRPMAGPESGQQSDFIQQLDKYFHDTTSSN